VVERAREILSGLEQDELARGGRPTVSGSAQPAPTQQLALFSTASAAEERLVSRLRDVDINRLTPIDALTLLASLKKDAES
jgi:DNA mismatch repair protein MutS